MAVSDFNNKYENKSAKEMLAEIARLTLMLIWKITSNLMRLIANGAKWLVRICRHTISQLIEWWNANDTQAKIRIMRIKTKIAAKTFAKWTVIAFKATYRFTVWAVKSLIRAIIHLKPTIVRIWSGFKNGCKAIVRSFKRLAKSIQRSNTKRKIAYKRFRQHPGFKGLLIDIGNYLKGQIDKYMEEEQYESETDSVDEVELLTEMNDSDNKAQMLGKRLFSKVKDIVDLPDDKANP